jgi:hypothetical protein
MNRSTEDGSKPAPAVLLLGKHTSASGKAGSGAQCLFHANYRSAYLTLPGDGLEGESSVDPDRDACMDAADEGSAEEADDDNLKLKRKGMARKAIDRGCH